MGFRVHKFAWRQTMNKIVNQSMINISDFSLYIVYIEFQGALFHEWCHNLSIWIMYFYTNFTGSINNTCLTSLGHGCFKNKLEASRMKITD